ncbi:serine/threonine kinase 16 [Hyaloscypha hepaticicola]|uniref:Serine/threonine kinase 16 n=1 Tax=Hyaloscypha hepaticicola TaxID=2082293 RepID=A0A2J6Q5S2_9HELO|nr:serine/threonine kinase 16 [Hyaloscypha hepaticicola]
MGLGVLEDHKLAHVPGTVLLNDEAANSDGVTQGLKHGTGKDSHIVLSPQPSEDPNDPLNWPKWKKDMITVILCLGAMLNAGTNGPFLNASYAVIADQVQRPISVVVLVSGYNLLAAGCSGPIVCALSRKYGKRPVFLVSTLFDIIGTAIGEAKISYNYLLAARIVQGFSTSAFESLLIASIGDMYYVHQRGARVAIINFILNSASSLASIICGQVFAKLGWLWLFHMFQIFLVIQFVLMFLFCPETTYLRDTRYETDTTVDEKLDELAKIEEQHREVEVGMELVNVPAKKTFVQELAVYTGVYSKDNVFKFLLGPFLTLLNPAGCYAVITSGLLNAWYVGSAIILAGIFSGPPWMFGPSQIGYIGAGPFIGGMIGSIFVGWFSDPIIKYMGKRNNGVYEPEFRLVFMSGATVFMGLGMFFFGYTMAIGANATLCAFLQGVMMVGVLIGIFATLAYGLDAFRSQSSEIFIMNMLFKNFMFYGLSNFANPWVESKGPEQIMYVFGGTSIFMGLLAIPVYIFGKRMRSWWSRHDLFVLLKMETTGPKLDVA